jgi:hypothetical protein
MRGHNSTTYEIAITRHAKHRFCQRAQTPDQRAAARHLTNAIEHAVQDENLLHCARNLYAVLLERDLVALCAVTGPPQKPISIAVITVLTSMMAITSFHHLAQNVMPALIDALAA